MYYNLLTAGGCVGFQAKSSKTAKPCRYGRFNRAVSEVTAADAARRDRRGAPRLTSIGGWFRRRSAPSCCSASPVAHDRKEALARDMTREMGRSWTRRAVTFRSDRHDLTSWPAKGPASTARPCRPSCATVRDVDPARSASARSSRRGNFPMAIPVVEDHSGVVCGQYRRLQAATLTPLSGATLCSDSLERGGDPPRVVNLVTGGARSRQRDARR